MRFVIMADIDAGSLLGRLDCWPVWPARQEHPFREMKYCRKSGNSIQGARPLERSTCTSVISDESLMMPKVRVFSSPFMVSVTCFIAAQCMNTQSSYDRVADEYTRRIFDELQHKPLDRQLLDRFAANVCDIGPVCDVGCGPGHVARYLHERGVQVCGIDLSSGMVEQARRLNEGINFREGDMRALDASDETWAGITAFYSLIHIPRSDMVRTLRELHRTLRPGGLLLISFHLGDETIHLDEWWGQKVCVDFFLFQSEEVGGYLTLAGFEIEEVIEREPYPEIEHQSRRAYIFARRPN